MPGPTWPDVTGLDRLWPAGDQPPCPASSEVLDGAVVTMVAALLGEFEDLTLGDELCRFPADIREEVQPR